MDNHNQKNIIKYLQEIKFIFQKKNINKFDNIIDILIDLLLTKHIKEFLRRYDIFIQDLILITPTL